MAVLIGQYFALCGIIVSKVSPFYAIILGNMATSILIFSAMHLFQKKAPEYSLNEITYSKRFKLATFAALLGLFAFEMLQVAVSRGFPLLWLITGNGKTYIDFGITSLNGLLNAIYLASATAFFLICLKERKKGYWGLFFILLLLPVILVSRQLIICLFLQITCCLLIYKPKSLKKVVCSLFLVLTSFVILGNFRTGLDSLVNILQPAPFIPEFMYSLLWIYAYVVTPFNNVNAAIDYIQPLGIPYNEATMLMPTFLQTLLGFEVNSAGFELVHEQMNVSTFYLPLIQDLGKLYAFLFMILMQGVLSASYRKVFVSRLPIDVMQYSILYMITALSLFSNLLLYLPVVFQLVMISAIQFSLSRKEGLVVLKQSKLV